jgi:hypothetical protein
MTEVEWNLFAEGMSDHIDLERGLSHMPNDCKLTLYVKRECKVCHQMSWIKYGYGDVCNQCMP